MSLREKLRSLRILTSKPTKELNCECRNNNIRSDLAQGQTARVTKIGGERALRRRLMDMGITKRVEITMVKASPLGDPVEYRLRGYTPLPG